MTSLEHAREYLAHAREAAAAVRGAESPDARAALIHMAGAWVRLSEAAVSTTAPDAVPAPGVAAVPSRRRRPAPGPRFTA